ncbi:mitochondrial ribosomal protein S31-like protein [Leptotrombidium deliense]|uniref:Small ribosomal subunit protein mS31 n=1 Tax=Leptotrombidium deliense TaxID=299467 RepID=A0A443S0S7_9ACAR|nr:mitochondrial ribosomal protein S31-like protein [Leptotrombidium deliense]
MTLIGFSMNSAKNLRVWKQVLIRCQREWLRNAASRRCLCDESSKDKDLVVKKEESKKVEAKKKLDELLKSMIESSSVQKVDETFNKKLAKPDRTAKRKEIPLPPPPAMKEVSPDINQRLKDAAKVVGQKIGGVEGKKTESELLRMLKRVKEDSLDPSINLKDLIAGMKVDRDDKPVEYGRYALSMVRESRESRESDTGFKRRPPPIARSTVAVDKIPSFFKNAKPLNIFDENLPLVNPEAPILETWNRLEQHELKMLITHAPENAFEEMIRWTEQGKLWKYPINNEEGLEEEAKVPFYEHVLLDEHLEGFPEKGPIRDFMELVIIGLSKNHSMTADRKKLYIDWYREYFNEKEPLLKACGAV